MAVQDADTLAVESADVPVGVSLHQNVGSVHVELHSLQNCTYTTIKLLKMVSEGATRWHSGWGVELPHG